MIKEKSTLWPLTSLKLGAVFSCLPFSPNFYTWLTLPFAILGLISTIYGHIPQGVTFFIAAGVTDLIDGGLARYTHQTTHFGAFLDGSLDRFVDFLVLFSYFWLHIDTPLFSMEKWLCLSVFFAIMPSFIVAYANHRQAVPDPTETVIWRILNRGEMFFAMMLIPVASLWSSVWAGYWLILLVGLAALTTFQTLLKVMWLCARQP